MGAKENHDKEISKRGSAPCSWQSGLTQAPLPKQWIMGAAPEDVLWPQHCRTAAILSFPSLKPPVNTSLFQKYVGLSGCDLSPNMSISFPSVASSISAEVGCVPPHIATANAETWRQYLEGHRCLPETSPGCWCLWRPLLWASVRINKLIPSPAYPQTGLKLKACNIGIPIRCEN